MITFAKHGLGSGDVVVYQVSGNAPITTSGGGALVDGREYAVIVRGDDSLSLGAQFKGSGLSNALALIPAAGAQGVDGARDMIRFATPHKFANGDAVRCRPHRRRSDNPGSPRACTTCTSSTISQFQLFASESGCVERRHHVLRYGQCPAHENRLDLAGYANGDRVTYRDPTPVRFRSSDVQNTVDGSQLPDGGFADNHTIFVGTLLPNSSTVLAHT